MRDPDLTRLFMQIFQEKISIHIKVESAYHHTELYWHDNFGHRFYKNFPTFRSAKSQYIKKARGTRRKTC